MKTMENTENTKKHELFPMFSMIIEEKEHGRQKKQILKMTNIETWKMGKMEKMNGTLAGHWRGNGPQEQQQGDTETEHTLTTEDTVARTASHPRHAPHARHAHGTRFPCSSMTFSNPPTKGLQCFFEV